MLTTAQPKVLRAGQPDTLTPAHSLTGGAYHYLDVSLNSQSDIARTLTEVRIYRTGAMTGVRIWTATDPTKIFDNYYATVTAISSPLDVPAGTGWWTAPIALPIDAGGRIGISSPVADVSYQYGQDGGRYHQFTGTLAVDAQLVSTSRSDGRLGLGGYA